MTSLQARKTKLEFETFCEVRDGGEYRAVVIEALPRMAVVRLKGTRKRLEIPWDAVYSAAAKLEAARTYREKQAKKAGAR